jgi:hypothetical protein
MTHRPPTPLDRRRPASLGLGPSGEPHRDRGHAVVEVVAALKHPVIDQVAEQRRTGKLQGGFEVFGPTRFPVPLELLDVDPARQVPGHTDPFATRMEPRRAILASDGAPDLPERRAQRPAGGAVEDVRPKTRGHVCPHMQPGMQQQPRQHGPCRRAGGHTKGHAVELERQRSEQAHAEHKNQRRVNRAGLHWEASCTRRARPFLCSSADGAKHVWQRRMEGGPAVSPRSWLGRRRRAEPPASQALTSAPATSRPTAAGNTLGRMWWPPSTTPRYSRAWGTRTAADGAAPAGSSMR